MNPNVMDESKALLGDDNAPVDFNSYKPKETASAAKLIQDEEDSEADMKKQVEQSEEERKKLLKTQLQQATTSIPQGSPDYPSLLKRLESEALFGVKNVSDTPLVLDWDLTFMPADIEPDFKKYLTAKYLQYGFENLVKANVLLVTLYIDKRSINFIEQFMNERQIPTLIPMQVGKESVIKSQFVIQPGEQVLVTKRQLETLQKYEKIKRVFPSEKGDDLESDWLGFLIFKEVTSENIEEFKRSYVTLADTMKSSSPVSPDILIDRVMRKEPGIVRATE